jgi:3-isopropylmalate/(R)-2-methylmalate dehydratase small subunit
MPDIRSEFSSFQSRTFNLCQEDIDTDQIIPARFLTTTSREGLGRLAFHDWRYDETGEVRTDCALNSLDTQAHKILVAGRNFGCGSSREHAPWALHDFGIRVVISTEIADIFRGNAAKNNVLPVIAPADAHAWLIDHPGTEVDIDLAQQVVSPKTGPSFRFEIEPFAKLCLMTGTDPLGFLLSQRSAIQSYEAANS